MASPGLPQHQNLGRLLVSSGREGDIASLWSSPHHKPSDKQPICPRPQTAAGATGSSGAVPGAAGGSCFPHRADGTCPSVPLQLTRCGGGKAEAGSRPHTRHSTKARWLHQAAPSPLWCQWPAQSCIPAAAAKCQHQWSLLTPRPAQLHPQLQAESLAKPRGAWKRHLFVLWADSAQRVKPFSSLIFPSKFSSNHGENNKPQEG